MASGVCFAYFFPRGFGFYVRAIVFLEISKNAVRLQHFTLFANLHKSYQNKLEESKLLIAMEVFSDVSNVQHVIAFVRQEFVPVCKIALLQAFQTPPNINLSKTVNKTILMFVNAL